MTRWTKSANKGLCSRGFSAGPARAADTPKRDPVHPPPPFFPRASHPGWTGQSHLRTHSSARWPVLNRYVRNQCLDRPRSCTHPSTVLHLCLIQLWCEHHCIEERPSPYNWHSWWGIKRTSRPLKHSTIRTLEGGMKFWQSRDDAQRSSQCQLRTSCISSTRDERGPPQLPEDVFLHIFDQLQPGAEMTPQAYRHVLGALTLVCKAFRTACQPLLFRTITVVACWPPRQEVAREQWLNLSVAQDPRALSFGQLVRSCTISLGSIDHRFIAGPDPPSEIHVSSRWFSAIETFSNLRRVQLRNMVITILLLQTLASLPALVELKIYKCEVAEKLEKYFPQRRGPGLRVLETYQCWGIRYSHYRFHDGLLRLLDRPRLRRLSLDDEDFLLGVFVGETLPCMEELDMAQAMFDHNDEGARCDLVKRWLLQCPNLRSLMLPRDFHFPFDFRCSSLSSLACSPETGHSAVVLQNCPSLTSLAIYSEAARPVCKALLVYIADAEFARITHLTLSTTVFKLLRLDITLRMPTLTLVAGLGWESNDVTAEMHSCMVYITTYRARFLSTTLCLELANDGTERTVYGLGRSWRDRSSISTSEFDLEAQKSLLEDTHFQDAFPHLQRFCVGGILVWSRSCSSDGPSWRPSVLDQTHLKHMLESPLDGEVRDVDGCIAGAFEPGELNAAVLERRGLLEVRGTEEVSHPQASFVQDCRIF